MQKTTKNPLKTTKNKQVKPLKGIIQCPICGLRQEKEGICSACWMND